MDNHRKKKTAPIIITIIMLIYFAVYFGVLISLIPSTLVQVILAVAPLLLGGAMICVCVQRIKEIDGGEEDDLGKY